MSDVKTLSILNQANQAVKVKSVKVNENRLESTKNNVKSYTKTVKSKQSKRNEGKCRKVMKSRSDEVTRNKEQKGIDKKQNQNDGKVLLVRRTTKVFFDFVLVVCSYVAILFGDG